MVIFLYNPYIFVWIQHNCLANMVFALDSGNSVIMSLWCNIIVFYEIHLLFQSVSLFTTEVLILPIFKHYQIKYWFLTHAKINARVSIGRDS